jgi:hypothetical protein
MDRLSAVAERIAVTFDIDVMVFSNYTLVTHGLDVNDNDLRMFRREVDLAEKAVLRKADGVVKILGGIGIKGRIYNVGITPKDGVLGVVIGYKEVLTQEQREQVELAMGGLR